MSSPSGGSVWLRYGAYDAEIVEVGAGLRSLRRGGDDVIDGYRPDEMCTAGRGQLLIPWPNRIEDGRYDFGGSSHQLPLSEATAHNAIHGLTRWVAWELLEQSPSSARCGLRLHPQPGYPYALDLEVGYLLGDFGLRVEVRATNLGTSHAPYGHGAHPYLTVGRRIDECELMLPAWLRWETDDRGLPAGQHRVEGGPYDFRSSRLIGATRFDHPFGDLVRLEGGFARTTLLDPATGRTATLWADPAYRWLQVFSGDPLQARARQALAVEPMTCPPNAFRSGVDVVVLGPGETHVGVFGLC